MHRLIGNSRAGSVRARNALKYPILLFVLAPLTACGQGMPPVEATAPSDDPRILEAPTTMSDGSAILPHRTESFPTSIEMISDGAIGGMSIDAEGNIYNTNFATTVWRTAPNGETVILNDEFTSASGNLPLPNGDLLQADWTEHKIFRIRPDGTRDVFSEEGLEGPVGMVIGPTGNVLVANHRGDYIARVPIEGGPAEVVMTHPEMTQPNGVTMDFDGNVYVSDLGTGKIFKLTPEGETSVLVELPGEGTSHSIFAGGALYVNKIWDHVIYRVELDTGVFGIVTGNGRAGYDDGPVGVATIEEPNGIATNAAKDVVYFNTHRGEMMGGEGRVIIRRLVIPN